MAVLQDSNHAGDDQELPFLRSGKERIRAATEMGQGAPPANLQEELVQLRRWLAKAAEAV